jgi:ribosomal-protein-alanine N-acetyltransferase
MTTAAVIERPPTAHAACSTHHLLTTNRLVLRVIESSDLDNYVDLMTDPAVMKFIGLEPGKLPTRDDIATIVDLAVDAWTDRGYGRWSVFDRVTDEFAGFAGFRCEEGVPELMVVVHERFWGNGYASEAAEAVLNYGFSELGFDEVCSFTRPTNNRARTLLDKLGAEFLGLTDYHNIEGAAYRLQPG